MTISSDVPPPSTVPTPGATNQRQPSGARLYIGTILLIIVALAVVVTLAVRRRVSAGHDASARAGEVTLGPLVRVTAVSMSAPVESLSLLGEARPFVSVTLYAKVSGYLRSVLVDKGDRVTKGEVLASIESPETDRAYAGAKADYDNKAVISSRIDQLLTRKLISPAEGDQARTDAMIAQERLAGLAEIRAYETLRAPLSGTVTARYADPGALVQDAATSQTNALPLVTVSQTDLLRVYVYLDQGDAARVRPGTRATITLQERPDVHIAASVTRLSGMLDPKTRKMLTELDVDNRDGAIVPGSFVQVMLNLPVPAGLEAPAEALIVRGGHMEVGVVGTDARVHFRNVTVIGNNGRTVIFGSGVHPGERLALSLSGGIADGTSIRPDTSSPATPAPAETSKAAPGGA